MLGTGAGLILRGSASSGGFDILAVILNQKYKLPVATVMNICDVLVILMLALGKPLLPTVYGILTITISAAIVSHVITPGTTVPRKRVCYSSLTFKLYSGCPIFIKTIICGHIGVRPQCGQFTVNLREGVSV